MISNIEIIYGLANRCLNYGIKNTISSANLNSLDQIFKICDGVDGAEKYLWDKNDLRILKKHIGKSNFTKIDITSYSLEEIVKIIQIHSNKDSISYLRGIYIHNEVNSETIDLYNKYRFHLKSRFDIKLGFSVYKQNEIDLITTNNLETDIIQMPRNFNVEIDLSELNKTNCEIYLRSIFLQGIYFTDIKNKFNHNTISNINNQKNFLISIANQYKFELGQYLFSEAITYCLAKNFKGIIIGSSSLKRLITYVKNHKVVKTFEKDRFIKSDMIDIHLADPRIWKK